MGAVFTPEYLAQRAERQRALSSLHTQWTLQQVAAGVDGPVPAGRTAGSDYNQHTPDLDALGKAQDAFDTAARKIMGLPPLED